ncbi:protein CANDIDATE G-PROTEIN COUPLED RECEPTOR 2-like [Tasmannia lanceolata]|uniref:protein CANDIDATE G-PROTEIN COUPLED RECEPTOR 2-like n=1 Tax=Tasmannia lanceolata TaxID=3420 RepID=UPI0040641246
MFMGGNLVSWKSKQHSVDVRSSVEAWQCTPGKELAWNILSLFTTSGMLFLEVSLLAFLLQGNHASGLEALTRTFVISGIIVGADLLLKHLYQTFPSPLFCNQFIWFWVPLFIDGDETNGVKWDLWVVHKLLLTIVYGPILFMHHTRWRERLPARPVFYNYIFVMFLLNAIALFACMLIVTGAGFGFWLYNLTTIYYHSIFLFCM